MANLFGPDFFDTVLSSAGDMLSDFTTQLPQFSAPPSTNLTFDFASPFGYSSQLPGGTPLDTPLPGGGNPLLNPGYADPFSAAQQEAINAARNAGGSTKAQQSGGPEAARGEALTNPNSYGPGSSAQVAVPAQGPLPDYARAVAQQYGVDPDIFVRQINQESGFQTGRRSKAGAAGIAQFMPDTARAYGVNVDDPYSSLDGAARHMRDLLQQFHGDYRLALAAYNAGAGNVTKYGGVPPFQETQKYVRAILGD